MCRYVFVDCEEGLVNLYCCMNCFEDTFIKDSDDICPLCDQQGMLIEVDKGYDAQEVFGYKLLKIEE